MFCVCECRHSYVVTLTKVTDYQKQWLPEITELYRVSGEEWGSLGRNF